MIFFLAPMIFVTHMLVSASPTALIQEPLPTLRSNQWRLGVATLPIEPFYVGYMPFIGYERAFSPRLQWSLLEAGMHVSLDKGLQRELKKNQGAMLVSSTDPRPHLFLSSYATWVPAIGKWVFNHHTVFRIDTLLHAGVSCVSRTHDWAFGPVVGVGMRAWFSDHVSLETSAKEYALFKTIRPQMLLSLSVSLTYHTF